MAFSRTFKNHIWHIQLATGDVVTTDARRLQRAFRCGLVDGRTLVRASTAPTWQPLAEAAELEPAETPASSFTPPETHVLLSDQAVAPLWKVRDEEVDPRCIRGSRFMPLSLVGGLLTILALVGFGVTARAEARPRELSNQKPPAAAPAIRDTKAGPPPSHEAYRALHDGNRFDRAERKRLLELDYVHRMQGFGNKNTRWHVVSPSIKAFSPPATKSPRVSNAASRWDPLNGDL